MSMPTLNRAGVSGAPDQAARWASAFFTLSEVGFVLLRPDGQVHDATPTACELFGATDADHLRSRWSPVLDTLAASFPKRLDGAQIVEIASDPEDGGRSVRCEVHALPDDDVLGYLLVVQSPDRMTGSEGGLCLASRYQTLASLGATTTHDVNGSLNAMTLNVELLARTLEPGASRANDAEVRQRCLRAIRQELDRFSRSIGSVLDEGRLDQASPSRCHLAPILESLVSQLRARADRQGVMMRLDVSDAAIEIMGRTSEIRQLVLSLAHNALEAMPRGGELSLNLTTDGQVAVLTVSDPVPGELTHRVWDLCFSTRRLGLGMGLHVVESVPHAHGGTVTLNQTSSGSQITLRLPLAR